MGASLLALAKSIYYVYLAAHLNSRGLGESSKVMQTLDYVSSLHNCLEFSAILPTLLVFRWGYVNTEKVLYCFKYIGVTFNFFGSSVLKKSIKSAPRILLKLVIRLTFYNAILRVKRK